MKNKINLLVILFLLFSCNSLLAQYGGYGGSYGGYGGYGGGYGGRMGQMGGMRGMNHEPSKPKEIPVEVTVSKIMERIKPELKLDALQEIAVANILTESLKSQAVILKQETNQEDKLKEIKTLSELNDAKIMQLLNAEQKEKYKAMQEEAKNPNKSSSKKRKKDIENKEE